MRARMKSRLISCVVPVFNGERYLKETLDSILAQSYEPKEIIVVDDGSVDRTAGVVARYGQQVRYVWQSNAGEAAARDRGLSVAQGDYIAFLDADDLWHPEKLTRQIARLRERPEIDLCFTWFRNFWIAELAGEQRRLQEHPMSQLQTGWSISTLLTWRMAFEKFGKFSRGGRTPGSESMIWYLRAAERGAVIDVLPDVLMSRRLHPTNVSRRHGLEPLFPILKEWRDYKRKNPSSGNTNRG
jgi:glycosyltransferase involved in cell wall biosynthesis